MLRERKPIALLWLALAVVISSASVTLAEEGGTGGQDFRAFDQVNRDVDPENSTNEVISWDTTGDARPGVNRRIHRRTQVAELDNQVQLKYYFDGRTCGGGSPRIQLAVDTDGDGVSNGNAFGYLGDVPFGGGCLMGQWVFEDMTNNAAKWDLTQFGGSFTNTWAQMEAFFAGINPNHEVLNGVLVDDSCGFFLASCGKVFIDNLVIGNRELDNHEDVSGAD